jgi:hypothetical protein
MNERSRSEADLLDEFVKKEEREDEMKEEERRGRDMKYQNSSYDKV